MPIEDLKPGDMIQVQPDDDQGDGKPEDDSDREPCHGLVHDDERGHRL